MAGLTEWQKHRGQVAPVPKPKKKKTVKKKKAE